jgi:hypothetical protein
MVVLQVSIGRVPTDEVQETMLKNKEYTEGNGSQYILISSSNFINAENWIDIDDYTAGMNEAAVKLFKSFGVSKTGYGHKNLLVAYDYLSNNDDVVFVDSEKEFFGIDVGDSMGFAVANPDSRSFTIDSSIILKV